MLCMHANKFMESFSMCLQKKKDKKDLEIPDQVMLDLEMLDLEMPDQEIPDLEMPNQEIPDLEMLDL